MATAKTAPVVRTLNQAQSEVIKFWQGYGVPVQWFVGETRDNGSVEVIALGTYSPDDLEDPRQFVWSFVISEDGQDVSTSEAEIPDGFETGITI